MSELKERIKESLENIQPWQRVPTSINGLFLIKTPEKGNNPTIMVEINPLNDEHKPIKRRGLFLRKPEEIELFLQVMENVSTKELVKAIYELNNGGNEEPERVVKI